jgi:DNA topoisomerase-1
MPVVVVESPAKAKTINKYLGSDYTVLASYGHVRDLPPKDGSVDTKNNFEMLWEISAGSQKYIQAISDALKDDNNLILATDPDREGEAISWHLEEALLKKKVINKTTEVTRVVFNAITKSAITEAMAAPRKIDMELVEAYLARRALDYLVGFNLSPVLWRKLPGAKSAGRVQSVCLRLIVEAEMTIEAFKSKEYWTINTTMETPRGVNFDSRLTILGGVKLDKFDLKTKEAAELAAQAINSRDFTVKSLEAKPINRNPAAPFMTSTLQQEASRKFGFGAKRTMSIAQRLYEAGHITYMRTDGIDMAPEAIIAVRKLVNNRYGEKFVPKTSRIYKNKAKNAQEAHECIRPTEISADAPSLNKLDQDQNKLYDLIWKRTVASQMASARMERTTIDIISTDEQVGLRSSGQVIRFDGFLKVYEEGKDDAVVNKDEKRLPSMATGDNLSKKNIIPDQHFTQPPARYTEATLVKKMEELGIGRPSTYASIVTTIQERDYVRKEKGRLHPEDKGRLVIAFLENYFRQYVGYNFTAGLEEELDLVSAGKLNYKKVLENFWSNFSLAIAETADLRITEVLEKINEILAPHIFPPNEDGSEPRTCKICLEGRLSMRTSRSGGAFIGCSNYPECKYTRPLSGEIDNSQFGGPDGKLLGYDNDEPIFLKNGRFGPFVQRTPQTDTTEKPPRASIPKGVDLDNVDLKLAIDLLSLPRYIGDHPDGGTIQSAIGRYGPYVVWEMLKEEKQKSARKIYANIPDPMEVFTIGMNRAVEVISEKTSKTGKSNLTPLKELGEHPSEGGVINVMDGRYGPYVKWEKINATIPKEIDPHSMDIERALELIEDRISKTGKKKKTLKKKTLKKKKD